MPAPLCPYLRCTARFQSPSQPPAASVTTSLKEFTDKSSLGYLFGSGEAPAPAKSNAEAAPKEVQAVNNVPASKPAPAASEPVDDRPSTKVHSAPGGGSSLGYLFGGGPAGGGGN
uniref:Uncharacterized protein n=1 Tax=Fagus sylvatica TaxID=28930 RepID=A0A2N9EVB8_FAGSY